MKKILSLLLISMIILSMYSTVAMATDNSSQISNTTDTYDDYYKIVGVDDSIFECIDENIISDQITLTFDELIKSSTNITRSNNSQSGTYKSAKLNAGLTGYKYQISFDWEAEVDSSNNYVFKKITNAKITTYENAILLSIAWPGDSWSYVLTKNTYTISNDKRFVTFYTNYKFTLYDSSEGSTYNYTSNNTKPIDIEDLL